MADPQNIKQVVVESCDVTCGNLTFVPMISGDSVPVPHSAVIHPSVSDAFPPEDIAGCAGMKFIPTTNRWMTKQAFLTFGTDVVIPAVEEKRTFLGCAPNTPAIVIADGHCSRYSYEAVKSLFDARIHLVILPPNTTHVLQPLDSLIFSLFESEFVSERRRQAKEILERLSTPDEVANHHTPTRNVW